MQFVYSSLNNNLFVCEYAHTHTRVYHGVSVVVRGQHLGISGRWHCQQSHLASHLTSLNR